MTYEDFLQIPYSFAADLEKLLAIKEKWDLPLSEEEKKLKRYYHRYMLERQKRSYEYVLQRQALFSDIP